MATSQLAEPETANVSNDPTPTILVLPHPLALDDDNDNDLFSYYHHLLAFCLPRQAPSPSSSNPAIIKHIRTHPGPTVESQCGCLLGNNVLGEGPNPFLTHNCSLGHKPGQGSLVTATTKYGAHDLPEPSHATSSPAATLRKVSNQPCINSSRLTTTAIAETAVEHPHTMIEHADALATQPR